MFIKQITLLQNLIEDWENIQNNQSNFEWKLDAGICTNCNLGFYSLHSIFNISYEEIKIFIDGMYKDFPYYTNDLYYPFQTVEEYKSEVKLKTCLNNPLRLELAKHCLKYLQQING